MSLGTPPNTFVNGTAADADEVNENFEDIYTSMLLATGDTMTGTLNSRSIIPTSNNTYDLGSTSLHFRNIYVAGSILGAGSPGNAFGTIAVSGQSDVIADSTNDTLTLVAGAGITITTTAGTDTVTITNSGGSLSSSDNRIVRVDGTTGIQGSAVTIDDSGNISGIENLTISGQTILSVGTTATLASGNNNNLAISSDTIIPVDATAGTCTITGIAGGVNGRLVTLTNIGGSGTFNFAGEDANSTAANRIYWTSGNVSTGQSITIVYLTATNRWHPHRIG